MSAATQPSKTAIKNAKEEPKIYYGLHFYPGVAEYAEPDKKSFRILLNEQTLREMDKTFPGKPVFVRHVDEVNLDRLQEDADGYVIESFYNEADGKHWCKFIIVSDRGHAAVRNGWGLSNAYVPQSYGPGGLWNGVEYQKEVLNGKFEHLAIVPDPRYEAFILTPSQFKEHNENQLLELKKVANSSKRSSKMFEFFKKTKVENADLSETVVKLPKSGKEVTLAQLINEADQDPADEDKDKKPAKADKDGKHESEAEEKKQGRKDEDQKDHEAPMMANMEHHVMDGDKARPLHEVMKEHKEMRDCMGTMSKYMKHNDSEMDGGEKDAEASQKADLTKRNADEDGGEKEAAEQEKSADETHRNDIDPAQAAAFGASVGTGGSSTKSAPPLEVKPVPPSVSTSLSPATKNEHFKTLKNAPDLALREPVRVDLDKCERGKARYGSGN